MCKKYEGFKRYTPSHPHTLTPGVNPAYDKAVKTIKQTAVDLEEYLHQQRKRMNCPSLVYWGTGRNRFQLEVPESTLSRQIPQDYELKSQKKGYRRFVKGAWLPLVCTLFATYIREIERDS